MAKSCLKKVPQSARLSAGGGVNAIWAMPTWGGGQVKRGFPKMAIMLKFGFPVNNLSKLMVTDVTAPPISTILCHVSTSCPPRT